MNNMDILDCIENIGEDGCDYIHDRKGVITGFRVLAGDQYEYLLEWLNGENINSAWFPVKRILVEKGD